MLKWFVCLFRGHSWYTWFDKDRRHERAICDRCGCEKSYSLFNTDFDVRGL